METKLHSTQNNRLETGARNRDRNWEEEKVALANQHICAIVFVIKLQFQADTERDRTDRKRKNKEQEGSWRQELRPAPAVSCKVSAN